MEEVSKSPMALILPPENPGTRQERALSIIRDLDEVLTSPRVRSYLDQCIQDGYTSVRKIQEGRYELFVMNAAGKGSLCLDKLLEQEKFSRDDKNALVGFAKQQARKDTRLSCSDDYKFANFSIIITYGKVNKQRPHIDLLEPNYQFGMLLSDASPATLVYSVDDNIRTVQDVEQLWNRWNLNDDIAIVKVMPQELVRAFLHSPKAMELVHNFGNVLIPENEMDEVTLANKESIQQGSLFSLPGNVIHAGPQSSLSRAILFFSGCSKANFKDVGYDPDTQYTGVLLCGELVNLLWPIDGVGLIEREYLLQILTKYRNQTQSQQKWSLHFPTGVSRIFLEAVETKTMSPETLGAFIKNTAKHVFIKQDFIDGVEIAGLFAIVSQENLRTATSERVESEIIVFQSFSGEKILIQYPHEEGEPWEGCKASDNYRLEMAATGDKFDGSNGKLFATDGEEIVCFCPARNAPMPNPKRRRGPGFTNKNSTIYWCRGCVLEGRDEPFRKRIPLCEVVTEEGVVPDNVLWPRKCKNGIAAMRRHWREEHPHLAMPVAFSERRTPKHMSTHSRKRTQSAGYEPVVSRTASQQSGSAFHIPPFGMIGFTEASMLPPLLPLGHVVAEGKPKAKRLRGKRGPDKKQRAPRKCLTCTNNGRHDDSLTCKGRWGNAQCTFNNWADNVICPPSSPSFTHLHTAVAN